jgi:hypothetical protein
MARFKRAMTDIKNGEISGFKWNPHQDPRLDYLGIYPIHRAVSREKFIF